MIGGPLPVNDPVEECLVNLESYLRVQMPELKQIIQDFPNANDQLEFPALSITHDANNGYTTLTPYEEKFDTAIGNTVQTLWIVGQWDFKIQLDFWARNKPERNKLFSRFFEAFNPLIEPMGLSLQLQKYYGLWARYDLSSYTHKDDEAASQRQEWRTMVGLLVHCKHALTQKQYVMTKPIDLELSAGMTIVINE